MKLHLSVPAAAAAVLALAAPAFAKGPSEATIDGPAVASGAIHLRSGGGDPGPGTPLGDLTEAAGFYPAAYGQEPNPMRAKPPRGSLGPKYTITYEVPGGSRTSWRLRQDLYPYADGGPVSYMKPGQRVFGTVRTPGGWFLMPTSFKSRLVAFGLPRTAPATGGGTTWTVPIGAAGAAVGALLLGGLAFGALRRRPRPARA